MSAPVGGDWAAQQPSGGGGMAREAAVKYICGRTNLSFRRVLRCGCARGPRIIRLTFCPRTDCGAENAIKPQDVIRCKDCGHRILYKKRTNKGAVPRRRPLCASPGGGADPAPPAVVQVIAR